MIVFFLAVSCKEADRVSGENARLKVIATIFPLYDFARNVGGDKITVTMLLPPGSDIHHYELKPDDVMRIGETDIFLCLYFKCCGNLFYFVFFLQKNRIFSCD